MSRDKYVRHLRETGSDYFLLYLAGRGPAHPVKAAEKTFPCIHCHKPLPRTRSSSLCSACADPEHFGFARGQYTGPSPE